MWIFGILFVFGVGYAAYLWIEKAVQQFHEAIESVAEEVDELEEVYIEEIEELKDTLKSMVQQMQDQINVLSTDNAQVVISDVPELTEKTNRIDERLSAVETIVGKRVNKSSVDTSLLP
jgi:HAMP domain-containing protein